MTLIELLCRHLLTAVLGLILTALALPAMAQSGYAVEVVIFRHWEAPGEDAEFWSRAPPPISRSATQRWVTLGPVARGSDAPPFSRLPSSRLQLAGIRERLDESNDYVVLLHVGWRQADLDPASTPAVVLPLNWTPPALSTLTDSAGAPSRGQNPFDYLPSDTRLWGTLRLLQRRYLDFRVDLRFSRKGIGAAYMDKKLTVYPMTQSRHMRVDEIHYLDHPVLGVLVEVRQLEALPEQNRAQAPQ
ncbi:MAG: peptidoglycan binding protein CsiV [Nitrococcus sp.]|nr:peptidoglycan binding protein CsiV [Nitrococcus sp.]